MQPHPHSQGAPQAPRAPRERRRPDRRGGLLALPGARAALAFGLLASAAFYLVPLWLAPRVEPALSLSALMALDAAGVALLARSRASVAALAAFGALVALTATLRDQLFVAAPSVLLYGGLAAVFAATLRPGRTALITRIALQRHGDALGGPARRYLHALTRAWAVFFAALALGSALLARFGPFEAWSLLVNVLVWPLIGAMFLGDYALRRWRYREVPPDTPAEVIAATLAYRPWARRTHD